MQRAFRAERIDLPIRDAGRGAGAFAPVVIVLVAGGVIGFPDGLAGGGIETLDDILVPDLMEENQLPAANGRGAVT